MNVKEIVSAIKTDKPEIASVYFVGCGASQADLYPGKYFLDANAKKLRASLHTANEFYYSTPAGVGPNSIVVACSLSGGTPETVALWLLPENTRSFMVLQKTMQQKWKK